MTSAPEPGETYYVAHGWSGCAGSAWGGLTPAARDGWRHAEANAGVVHALERVFEGPLSARDGATLRWAATHESLCRSFIFDVLMALADALPSQGVEQ